MRDGPANAARHCWDFEMNRLPGRHRPQASHAPHLYSANLHRFEPHLTNIAMTAAEHTQRKEVCSSVERCHLSTQQHQPVQVLGATLATISARTTFAATRSRSSLLARRSATANKLSITSAAS